MEKAVSLQRSAASCLKGAPEERLPEEALSLKGPLGLVQRLVSLEEGRL